MKTLATAAAVLFTSSLLLAAPSRAAPGSGLCEPEIVRAAAKYEVPLAVLYAVGITETGRGDSMRAYALNIEGKALYDITRPQALRAFAEAQALGAKLIDVGCLQINHHFHKAHFKSVEELLDPPKNVDYGARFLKSLHEREGSWTMAIARYHAGPDNDAAQKRYVCRVVSNMVATGFGEWTPEAKSLCKLN